MQATCQPLGMNSVTESSEQLVRYLWMVAMDDVPILQVRNVEAPEVDAHKLSSSVLSYHMWPFAFPYEPQSLTTKL